MATLHIEHPITDLETWLGAFGRFAVARAFKGFLETRVWSNPEASPGLDGTPRARVLTEVEAG
jgi:hypothetical protein